MDPDDVAAAHRAHDALVHALHSLEQAEKNAVRCFADVYHQRLFRCLGFASIHHYATEKLGFSPSKAAQFVRLAKDRERLPALAAAIDRDEISWTKARVIGPVATEETQQAWVDRARTTPRRELQQQVKQARKPKPPAAQVPLLGGSVAPAGDPPVRYGFDLTPHQAARVQKLTERVRPGRDRAELFLDALTALVESEHGEQTEERNCTRVQSPVQIVAYRCEKCDGVDVPTGSGLKRLSPADASAIACDADQVDAEGHKRSALPIRLRRQVLARDRHRCVRCGRTGWLHVHHRQRQADGGGHTLENCVAVCAPCHRVHHAMEGG